MLKLKEEFYLGISENEEVCFVEVEVKENNVFTMSFKNSYPFIASEEYLRDRFEGQLDSYDSDYKLQLLEEYDCRPSDLESFVFDDLISQEGVEGIIDTSSYPKYFNLEGIDDSIYFESSSGGQHDPREDKVDFVDDEFAKYLLNLWDNFHLKTIDDNTLKELKKAIDDYLNRYDLEEKIIIELEKIFL